ncbi:hypothetical protein STCU_04271 [Strigomonas culicis]|uniref:Uncharacterized protein n=1 Tax=Strigomonas culicis TaxID=28005 RepID=S9U3A6_9TRYP|nr:hypothetical protein STCU_08239 [Strigomonas culicis]EPY23279.1 hypothetical protein STCU_07784 [Strigomonas culicis]EPY24768.1 hypothetical protein STCU_07014 [Strigomonas culicis]EPY30030.1 hypothetical protein STCU_04271 [Strigomonas culicis]|eukprot:EPY22332.1 hypothetical protein STCU_08239 [Strigomonas culicis]
MMMEEEEYNARAQVTELPPHPPADMLDTYMTRYDYDYNRDPCGGTAELPPPEAGESISGHVRNRPIFGTGHPSHTGDANDEDGGVNHTVYRKDYRAPGRAGVDAEALAQAAVASLQQGNDGNMFMSHTFTRDGYTPAPRPHLDGTHPESVYKVDYTAPGAPRGAEADGTVYAGADAALYKATFLYPPEGVVEDDSALVAPKVGTREALLPTAAYLRGVGRVSPPTVDARGTSLGPRVTNPSGGPGRDFALTSYDYGDTSSAQRKGQLPQDAEGSRHAHLLGTEREPAKMLDLLAGRTRPPRADATQPNELFDLTNPVYMSPEAKERAAVSRRLEHEGNVHGQTIYRSDFINQKLLPELPGCAACGAADVRDTNTDYTATSGERVAGVLTRDGREQGRLRNGHGRLVAGATNATTSAEDVATMRREERAVEVEKADPHRHKLRS